MERIEVELFTDASNNAVIKVPGRRFPGVLIQGDSLSALRGDVARIAQACAQGNLDEARGWSDLVISDLDAVLARYCAALREHEIPLPFSQPHA
jgi:hypothetical protein